MKKLAMIIFLLPVVFAGCNSKKTNTSNSSEKWSIKMADAIMERHDSLAYYNGRTRAGWSYDVAMVGMAIDKLGKIDQKYSDYMKTYMDMLIEEDGSIPRYDQSKYNIDYINPARNIIILHNRTGEDKYAKALPQFIEQMENHPTTKTGGFWHKQRYPWQIWLDGVYMGIPFLTMYANNFDAPKWYDVATHEIKLTYEKTLDEETGLLYHAWDESKEQRWADPETGQSPHFWSRAMGWYVMALVDVLDYLPIDHPDRQDVIDILNKTIDALLKVRDEESGCWYQVLDHGGQEGNYLEGSGTAMYIYAMAKGANKGYLDKSYLETANNAFDDMVKTFIITDDDKLPSMINICGSCGLGGNPYRDGSYEYYTTETIVKNDTKGVGPFILAAIELNR
ncbi:MAG: glycoside hydrolase family 88 protein [Prolixibacteraceae bacterium]|jgi:unsaturated rhamnogalacturonyl hydrolase|nr:glycoside hydrolase family 88 protein [Prolixibacteraceae bacterium]